MLSYDELVKLARFCANQAPTVTEKVVRARAWRLAVQYREDAAKLGEIETATSRSTKFP